MTLGQILDAAMATASAGIDPDTSIYRKMSLEAEILLDQSLHDMEADIALCPELRPRSEKQFSVPLTNGVGAVPATMMVEFLGAGSVKDAEGNVLHRKLYKSDFDPPAYLSSAFGYYLITADISGVAQFNTRRINDGTLDGTVGPLTVIAPHVPLKANLNTELDGEVSDDLVKRLAIKLRGFIAEMPSTEAA